MDTRASLDVVENRKITALTENQTLEQLSIKLLAIGLMIGVQLLAGTGIFFFARLALWPNQLPIQWVSK
jgi:hypothetical protein